MSEGHSFFNLHLNKDSCLATLLFSIACVIPFIGWYYPAQTANYVAKFELLFVVIYLIFDKRFTAIQSLRKNKFLLFLCLTWFFTFSLSFVQLFNQNIFESQLYMATFRYIFTLMHMLFILCVISYFNQSKKLSILPLLSSPVIMLLIIFIFYLVITSGITIPDKYFINSPPLASNIRYIGYLCTVSSIVSGFIVLTTRVKLPLFYIIIAVAIANFTFLVWLGGRGAIGAVYACLILYIIYRLKYQTLNFKRVILISSVILFSIFLSEILTVYSWNGLGHIFNQSKLQSLNDLDINSFSSNRVAIWKMSLNAISESPWLGYGPNGYFYLPERTFGVHPHNLFIQFFLEWGIIGGTAFSLILFYAGGHIIKFLILTQHSNNDNFILPSLIICSLTLHALFDGTYYHAQPVFYLILSFAYIVSISTKLKS